MKYEEKLFNVVRIAELKRVERLQQDMEQQWGEKDKRKYAENLAKGAMRTTAVSTIIASLKPRFKQIKYIKP